MTFLYWNLTIINVTSIGKKIFHYKTSFYFSISWHIELTSRGILQKKVRRYNGAFVFNFAHSLRVSAIISILYFTITFEYPLKYF